MARTNINRLLALLKARGLSEAKFARQMGESPQTISNWKRRGAIPPAKLIKVAGNLRVSPIWLDAGSDAGDASKAEAASIFGYEFVMRFEWDSFPPLGGAAGAAQDEIHRAQAFERKWLLDRGLDPKRLRVLPIGDGSMSPYLDEGDVVLIDLDDRAIRSDCVYAIAVDHELRVKRLHMRADGALEIRSDHPLPNQQTETIARDAIDRINIIGRVVWRGG